MFIEYTDEEIQRRSDIMKGFKAKANNSPSEEQDSLVIQLYEALRDFDLQCQKNRFDKLNGDPKLILKDAEEQAKMTLPELYDGFFNIKDPEEEPDIEIINEYVQLGIGKLENGVFKLDGLLAADSIKKQLVFHIEAFKDNTELSHQLYSLIVSVIKESDLTTEIDISLFEPTFSSIPDSIIINQILRLSQARDFNYLEAINYRNRHVITTLSSNDKDDTVTFIRENKQKDSKIQIDIEEATQFVQKYNKGFARIFIYVLMKMNEQNYPAEVTIPLKEMVELNMYSRTDAALNAILGFYEQQSGMHFSAIICKGKKTVSQDSGILFYHYKYTSRSGHVKLCINENFNIDVFATFFTVFPRSAFKLKDNAFILIHYIFSQARQSTKDIKTSGSFNLNLDCVRDRLGLPPVKEVTGRHYKKLITKPITDAVNEINELFDSKEFTVEICTPEKCNITKWLSDGYLGITLSGDFAKKFIDIANKQEKKISDHNDRMLALEASKQKKQKKTRSNP